MSLTNTAVRQARPRNKDFKLSDGGGMHLLVRVNGAKYWRLSYRYAGKQKTISLGVYPQTSLKTAREGRDEAKKLLADNIDPSLHRKHKAQEIRQSANNSFEVIALEWFAKQEASWAKNHASKVIRRLELYIFPQIGKVAIDAIKPTDVLRAIKQIENKGIIETAHRTLGHCAQVFRYAVSAGVVESNPTADLHYALRPKPDIQHMASQTEPKKVAELLRAIHGYEGSMIVQAALKFAPLVFVRPGELRQARWKDIDLDAAQWRFKASKTNIDHIVPLSRQALEVLRDIQPLTGQGTYVFPSLNSPDRAMSDNAVLSAFRRMGIEKTEMSGHGFRAMARTLLDEELGFRPDWIEHQLAHAVRDPNGRAYNRTSFVKERTEMMQTWADYIDGLRTRSNVVAGKFGRTA
jgi:integrase